MIKAEIITDSISPIGIRLTTMICTFPRTILAEVNTHRALSRNSASSRAIPVERIIAAVQENPFIPTVWTSNQKGMQGERVTDAPLIEEYTHIWLAARDRAISEALNLHKLNLHKQVINRLLEPFMWHTAIVSATEWGNLLSLRDSVEAEPHFAVLASTILNELTSHIPTQVDFTKWHIPFADKMDGLSDTDKIKVATARCARISYLTYDGNFSAEQDIRLHDQLLSNGHLSPFEHCAYALNSRRSMGNFVGWNQYRKTIRNENRNHPRVPNHL